ncbi:RNA recognition motif family protein [Leishmania donovani]|uniref:RNA recognition motif family protein n=1 Tax=Leishmania donovani TaxID=5661 RepID=A0A504Y1V3_LEIDO|nr:RNA recognition motif family protein [Leishmania donovani]
MDSDLSAEIARIEAELAQDADFSKDTDSRSIFIGNLPRGTDGTPATTPEELVQFFADCGNILNCTVLKDRATGEPKGTAYIEFADYTAMGKAIDTKNNANFKGSTIINMSTVNTEGMLEWCLGIQYALRTIGAYLQLGFSLGAVQARHACVPYQLVAYKATCAWRYNIAAPEDGPIYLEGPDAESSTQTSTGQTTKSIAPLCAQASGAVDPVLFLAELLAKFDSLAAITHGEAVDVRLLQRFMHQDILVCKQRHAQIAAGVAVPSKSSHASEESIVFRLSETDATYASVVAAGHPTTITYRDLVILITLLSEAIAWDLLGPLHTLLDVLYRNSNSEQPKTERGTYRPCRTALLNTNLASNTMLYHAMECSGSVMIVMDVAYVPLLFCSRTSDDADAEGVTSKLELHVPPHVKRIYLWRSTNAAGQPVSSAMTTEMEELLRAFNASAYGDAKSLKAANPSAGDSFVAPPSTPPLDLYDVVKPFLLRAQANPDFTVGEMRHTYLISSPRVRLLMHVILSRPPPSWKSMLALGKPSSAKNGGAEPYATAAGSVKSRKQLQHYKTKMVSILSRLLRRFHHTQPILFIYTSGTSGLPKAARFSHLRFFATGFLSRVLYYRDKIAETVVQQMNEVDYLHASGKRETPEEKTDKVGMPSVASSIQYHCPTVPHVFGIESLDFTCRERNIVEAALFALWSASLWCLRLFAAVLGLEYFVASAVEQRLYTPAQLAAIENERRLITLYNCLPMCHTVGSVFCLGHLLHALEEQQHAWAQIRRCAPRHTRLAATVPTVRMIIRTKFSASQFRKDLQRYHVTVVQYIGEVLRYAVLYERSHSPDIWLECMRRLNIAHPVEFYSSTEGNIFLLNLFGMPGIVGHIPRFPRPIEWLSMQYIPLFPFRVLRFNEETQQVYRDPKTGYCSHCDVGEVGEVVGEVIEGFDVFALRRFDGYHKAHHAAAAADGASIGNSSGGTKAKSTAPADQEEDEAARESKVARHVLWPHQNDCYFLSGDLIRMDRFGFCTFVDRIGDTFRWKGENVSTLEVSNALNSIHTTRVGVQEAVVYGVELPGREGRAGMAMLSLQPRHLRSSSDVRRNGDGTENQAMLPASSIPLFLRMHDLVAGDSQDGDNGVISSEVRLNKHAVAEDATQTSTFKYKKGILINQGYEFDGSSTTCAEAALKELALPPVGSKGASGAPHATGYVPLTTATRAILGANMEKCGW